MPTRNRPELMQLLRAKSMMRYLPPNTTAGLARSSARMLRRSPRPPAKMRARVRLICSSPRFSARSRGLQRWAGLRVDLIAGQGGVHLQMIAQIAGDEEVGAHVFAAGGAHAVGFLGVPQQVEDALGAGRGA